MKPTNNALLSPEILKGILIDENRDTPLYAQLRNSLRQIIVERFDDGDRFWSESQLVENLPVSLGTVQRALTDLAAEGYIDRKRARYSSVCKPSTETTFKHLAVFHPDFSSESAGAILDLMSGHCLERNIKLRTLYTHRGEKLTQAYAQLDFSPREGAVVLLGNTSRATIELTSVLCEKGYRHVIVGTLVKQLSSSFVGGSNFKSIEMAMDHLTGLGHRRIVLLSNEPEENENTRERVDSFERYLQAHPESKESWVHHCGTRYWDSPYDKAYSSMSEIWSKRPTALLAVSDMGALAGMKWCQQQGISIPGQISIMGFDGTDLSALVHPSLTSLGQPYQEIVNKIFELLEKNIPETSRIFLDPSLMVRESTGSVVLA